MMNVTQNTGGMGKDYLIAFMTALAACVFVPQYMIHQSPGSYTFINQTLLMAVGFVLSVLYMGLLFVVCRMSNFLNFYKIFRLINLFVFFWVVNAGFLLPLAGSVELVSPEHHQASPLNLVLLVLLSSVMLWLSVSRFRKYLFIYIAVFLGSTVIPILPGMFDRVVDRENTGKWWVTTLSPHKNIFVLSFDGLPGDVVDQLISESDELRSEFKDFTIFSNVLATSPGTTMSIAGELFGNIDFMSVAATEHALMKKLEYSELLINRYAGRGADVYTYGAYNTFNADPDTRIGYGGLYARPVGEEVDDIADFYRYVIARIGSGGLLKVFGFIEMPAKWFLSGVGHTVEDLKSEGAGETGFYNPLSSHVGPVWDRHLLKSANDLDMMLDGLSVGNAGISIRYMHFAHTHFPVDFDQDCRFRGDAKQWYVVNQNRQEMVNETRCALKQMAGFLKRFRQLDIYDESLLVLKSDHGNIASYYQDSPYSYRFNGNDRHGYGRYRPMLMIKGFNAKSEVLTRKSETVLLDDLAVTLCRQAEFEANCERFPGVDLLGAELSSDAPFNMYVVRNADADHKLDTHMRIRLSRNKPFLQSLQESGRVQISE